MSKPQTTPSIQLTRTGWVALLLSVAAGVGLRLALQVWDPDRFVQTTRNDPRQGGLAVTMLLIPAFFVTAAVALTLLGYRIFRASNPPATPPDTERGSDAEK